MIIYRNPGMKAVVFWIREAVRHLEKMKFLLNICPKVMLQTAIQSTETAERLLLRKNWWEKEDMMGNLSQNIPADKEVKLANLDLDLILNLQGNLLALFLTTNKTNILLDLPKRYLHPKLKILQTYKVM